MGGIPGITVLHIARIVRIGCGSFRLRYLRLRDVEKHYGDELRADIAEIKELLQQKEDSGQLEPVDEKEIESKID